MSRLTARLATALHLLGPALWTIPTADPHIDGLATYYAPGLMNAVATTRGIDLSAYAGGVALNRAGDLRRTVYLEWDSGVWTGPYIVVDCAQQRHFATREAANRVVEVDAETAQTRGFYNYGPVPVRVWFAPIEMEHAPQ